MPHLDLTALELRALWLLCDAGLADRRAILGGDEPLHQAGLTAYRKLGRLKLDTDTDAPGVAA
jgi:hypothetical protein